MISNKIINLIIKLVAIFGFLFFIFDKAFKENYFNYDSIPYVASAYMHSGNDLESAHKYAYELLKNKAHPAVFNDLCCTSSYRKSMYEDVEAFGSHLPAYQTKSLYVYLVRIITDVTGTDEFYALKIITMGSITLLTLLLALVFFNKEVLVYLCLFPILFLMQIIPLARLLTPDSLIALMMFSAGICFLKKKRWAGYVILFPTILLRQTNIIIFGLFLLFELKDKKYLRFCSLLAVSLIVYFLNSVYFESLGYWKTYNASLIRMPDTFIGFDPNFQFSILLSTLIGKLNWMLGNPELNRLIAIMALLFLISLYKLKEYRTDNIETTLVPLIFILGALLSYILIPFPDFRIYAGYLIASTFTLILAAVKNNSKLMK